MKKWYQVPVGNRIFKYVSILSEQPMALVIATWEIVRSRTCNFDDDCPEIVVDDDGIGIIEILEEEGNEAAIHSILEVMAVIGMLKYEKNTAEVVDFPKKKRGWRP